MPTKTNREVAERIVKSAKAGPMRLDMRVASFRVDDLIVAITAALDAECERCAKIAETRPESRFDLDHEPAPTEQQIRNRIAAAIREGKD